MTSPLAAAPPPPSVATPTGYSPAQQRVIDLLGRSADDPPPVADGLLTELRAELDDRLAGVAGTLAPSGGLWLGKSPLASFTTCPRKWLAERDRPFEWTVPMARGVVAHKAIELSINWRGGSAPAAMVDEAITRLVDDVYSRPGEFIRTLSTVELAELRGAAVTFVTAFDECFPPVKAAWRPVVEGSLRVRLVGGAVVLSGKPDLTLGAPNEGGKVVIDLKTGNESRHHRDDLRFYALLDALRLGVAPRRVASVYLDSGTIVAEAVTAGVLEAAVERICRTADAMADVVTAAEAPAIPGGLCRWCPAMADCVPGLAQVSALDDGRGW